MFMNIYEMEWYTFKSFVDFINQTLKFAYPIKGRNSFERR